MLNLTEAWKKSRKFHEDEDGIEQLNIVMILAVAALAGILIFFFWGRLREWAVTTFNTLFGEADSAETDNPF